MGFFRNKESFRCGHCSERVSGNGYTNHCPKCLWSCHVDIDPGDRAALCGGMMEPISVTRKHGEERIVHRCVSCGFSRENRTSDEDDREAIIGVVKRASDTLFRN